MAVCGGSRCPFRPCPGAVGRTPEVHRKGGANVVSPLPDTKLSDVLDLEHLRRYTLMDESLERELLSLFRDQARTQYEAALTASDQDQFRFAIHTLKGTARAIGAVAVAKATETIERLRLNHIEARSHSEMQELARAIGAAETAIVGHLG